MTSNSQKSTPASAIRRWEAGAACPKGLPYMGVKSHRRSHRDSEMPVAHELQGMSNPQDEFEFELKTGRARLT